MTYKFELNLHYNDHRVIMNLLIALAVEKDGCLEDMTFYGERGAKTIKVADWAQKGGCPDDGLVRGKYMVSASQPLSQTRMKLVSTHLGFEDPHYLDYLEDTQNLSASPKSRSGESKALFKSDQGSAYAIHNINEDEENEDSA